MTNPRAKAVAALLTPYDLALGLSNTLAEGESQCGGRPGAIWADEGSSERPYAAGEEVEAEESLPVRMGTAPGKFSADEQNQNPGSSGVGGGSHEKRARARKSRRTKKRTLNAEEEGRQVKRVALQRRQEMVDAQAFVSTEANAEAFKAAEGGWLGSRRRASSQEPRSLGDLLNEGFQLVKWDGKSPLAILDKSQRIVAVLAGMAKGNFEEQVARKATAAFKAECEALPPPAEAYARGKFHAVFTGISHGGGTLEPVQTVTSPTYKRAVGRLKENEAVARLAGFQNQAFQVYFPETHAYYRGSMQTLLREKPHLKLPFVDSLPAAAFNLGPQTVCSPHRDSKNLSFGICCITALGSFDPTAGGQLILEELQLVVEFPPGSTVLIPSAVVTHSNAKIQEGEERYSFTQYASGSLFSYVENKMRTDKQVVGSLTLEQKAQWRQDRRERWSKGLGMFPVLSHRS